MTKESMKNENRCDLSAKVSTKLSRIERLLMRTCGSMIDDLIRDLRKILDDLGEDPNVSLGYAEKNELISSMRSSQGIINEGLSSMFKCHIRLTAIAEDNGIAGKLMARSGGR